MCLLACTFLQRVIIAKLLKLLQIRGAMMKGRMTGLIKL